jgi:hypothetical protein
MDFWKKLFHDSRFLSIFQAFSQVLLFSIKKARVRPHVLSHSCALVYERYGGPFPHVNASYGRATLPRIFLG